MRRIEIGLHNKPIKLFTDANNSKAPRKNYTRTTALWERGCQLSNHMLHVGSVTVNYIRKNGIFYLTKSVIWMVSNSMRKEGFKNSIRNTVSFIEDFSFDVKYGTNTSSRIRLSDIEVIGENRLNGKKHNPTKAKPFNKLMNMLSFPNNSVFVDFGSGLGRILLLASQRGFKRVVGIEFSPELCEIAKKNVSIYKEQVNNSSYIEIIACDVIDYEIKNDENIFYFYNPFNEIVISMVLENIYRSLEKKQRKIWIIYNNPVHSDIIERKGIFFKSNEINFEGNKFSIYVNKKYRSSILK